MKYKPTSNYLLIKPTKVKDATKSGIIIPHEDKQMPQKGIIIAIGDNISEEGNTLPIPYKIGDTVLFKKWVAVEYQIDPTDLKSNKYLFLKHNEILSIVEED